MEVRSITATQIAYYHVCQHKLWLSFHGITMEHASPLVADGKIIHAIAFSRRSKRYKEIQIGSSKIDFYDPDRRMVHEIKRSNKMQHVDVWQIKYYILLLEQSGISGVVGRLEYPSSRETKMITIDSSDRKYLSDLQNEIKLITSKRVPPDRKKTKTCDGCAYNRLCWTI